MFKVGDKARLNNRAADHFPDTNLVGKVCKVIAIREKNYYGDHFILDVEFDDGTTNYFYDFKLDKIINNMKDKRAAGLAK